MVFPLKKKSVQKPVERFDSVIPLDVAEHVLWHFGDHNYGQQPGTFTQRLLMTVSAADAENKEKLRAAFPDLVTAFQLVSTTPWGLEHLRDLLKQASA